MSNKNVVTLEEVFLQGDCSMVCFLEEVVSQLAPRSSPTKVAILDDFFSKDVVEERV